MSHINADRDKLVARVRRIAGQIAAVERSIAGDASCSETLHLVAAVRGAVASLMDEIVEAHLRAHVAAPDIAPHDRAQAADELAAVLRRYMR